jgi:predicted DNA-binding protein
MVDEWTVVAFRLDKEHLEKLDTLIAEQGSSRYRLLAEIVNTHLNSINISTERVRTVHTYDKTETITAVSEEAETPSFNAPLLEEVLSSDTQKDVSFDFTTLLTTTPSLDELRARTSALLAHPSNGQAAIIPTVTADTSDLDFP